MRRKDIAWTKYQISTRDKKTVESQGGVMLIVLGLLGTLSLNLKTRMRIMSLSMLVETIQKSVLLGTARILRKVLEI